MELKKNVDIISYGIYLTLSILLLCYVGLIIMETRLREYDPPWNSAQ